jgi:probable rRNA maturation factor
MVITIGISSVVDRNESTDQKNVNDKKLKRYTTLLTHQNDLDGVLPVLDLVTRERFSTVFLFFCRSSIRSLLCFVVTMRRSPKLHLHLITVYWILVHNSYSGLAWSQSMSFLFRPLVTQSTRRLRSSSIAPATAIQSPCYCQCTLSRLFGSSTDNIPGEIYIEDDQTDLKLDLDQIRDTMTRIRKILGYETYSVSLLLVDDKAMQETNKESRNVDAPTDILSFPMLDAIEPGILGKPEFDIPDYYNLGDMLVDVPYVMRRCQEDAEDDDDENDDDEDASFDGDNVERGVSGAMATIFDPQVRVNMLLVHGMLHLVGHDHEEDDEYELMVREEERIMKELGMVHEGNR